MALKPFNVVGGLSAGLGQANVIDANGNVTTSKLTVATVGTDNGNGNVSFGSTNIVANTFYGNIVGNISGNIVVPGANTQVLFNNDGNAGASANLSFDSATQNLTANGNVVVTGGAFYGNAAGLTNIPGANVTGQVANALVAGTVTASAQSNITSVGTLSSLNVTANVTAGNLVSNGSANITNGLTVSSGGASITGDVGVTGNITVTGNLNYQNVVDLVVGDPLIYIGANNTANIVDLGIVASYNDGNYEHTGLARDHTDGVWKLFDNIANEPTTTIDFANGTYAGFKSGPITSTGNITALNADLGNAVVANYFVGTLYGTANAATVAASANSVAGANVTGEVAFANVANNVAGANVSGEVAFAATANAVAGANVSGTVASATVAASANSVAGANVSGEVAFAATANAVAGANVSGAVSLATFADTANAVAGANVSGQVGNALVAGTVYTNAQPNITSVGTLANLTVAGTTDLGPVGNVTITGGTSGQVLTTNGSNVLSWTTIGTSSLANGNSNVTVNANANITLSANGQANIITVSSNGTVASTVFSGNVSGVNVFSATTGNITSASIPTLTVNNSMTLGSTTSMLGGFVLSTIRGPIQGRFYNNVGATATTGQVVYASGGGAATNTPGFLLAKADSLTTSKSILGFVTSDISAGNAGYIQSYGPISGSSINTSSATLGDPVYLSAATAGGFTFTKPSSPNLAIVIGYVSVVSTSGTIFITLGNPAQASHADIADSANAVAGANVTGTVANATFATSAGTAATVTTAAQSNITSLGTLTGLTSGGTVDFTSASNVTLGPVGNLHITGGSNGQLLTTDGSGTLSWSTPPAGYGNADVETLLASGNITGNITTTGNVTAGYLYGDGSNITNLTAGSLIANGSSNVSIPVANGNIDFTSNGNISLVVTDGKIVATDYEGNLNYANTAGIGSQSPTPAIAVGANASAIGFNAVAIGTYAVANGQNSTIVGPFAGGSGSGDYTVAVGYGAANTSQGQYAVAIGANAGQTSQGLGAVAIGQFAAETNQGQQSVAIGTGTNAGSNSIAIGTLANATYDNSIVLNATGSALANVPGNSGFYVAPVRNDTSNVANVVYYNVDTNEVTYAPAPATSSISNGTSNVNIPTADGPVTISTNGSSNVATFSETDANFIGNVTANFFNGDGSNLSNIWYISNSTSGVNVNYAGFGDSNITMTVEGIGAFKLDYSRVAIGANAANSSQSTGAIAIGANAASSQGDNAIAIGANAGFYSFANSIAIGAGAGAAANAIAIGTSTFADNNSIVLNATGSILSLTPAADGFYVAPVRNDAGNVDNVVYYNTGTNEVTYGPGPTAIINGTSNVSIPTADGDVTIASAGTTVVTITSSGANINGYANISGNLAVGSTISIGSIATQGASNVTTTSTSAATLATVAASIGDAVEFVVKGNNSGDGKYSTTKILVITTGASTVDYTVYGSVDSGGGAGIVSGITYDGTDVTLSVTASTTTSTVWATQWTKV